MRQLLRSLARNGSLDYAVLVPARARDAAEGLPTIEVKDPPVGKRGPLPHRADGASGPAHEGGRRRLAGIDVVHYPLTVPSPRVQVPTVVTLHDVQHRDLPEFFGPARRSFRRLAYDRAARAAEAVIVTSEFVRGRACEALGLDPSGSAWSRHAIDHSVFKPAQRGARAPRPLPGAAVAAQESRAAVPGVRNSARDAAAAATRPDRRRARAAEPLPEGVENLGAVPAAQLASLYRRAACSSFPASTRASACRRSRRWPVGVRSRRRAQAPSRRSAATQRCSSTRPTSTRWLRRCWRRTAAGRAPGARARACRAYTWDETARLHEDVYREVAPSRAR